MPTIAQQDYIHLIDRHENDGEPIDVQVLAGLAKAIENDNIFDVVIRFLYRPRAVTRILSTKDNGSLHYTSVLFFDPMDEEIRNCYIEQTSKVYNALIILAEKLQTYNIIDLCLIDEQYLGATDSNSKEGKVIHTLTIDGKAILCGTTLSEEDILVLSSVSKSDVSAADISGDSELEIDLDLAQQLVGYYDIA